MQIPEFELLDYFPRLDSRGAQRTQHLLPALELLLTNGLEFSISFLQFSKILE